ncbi:conserved hypothetical protein [Leishmania mexicana MHOM/GT/2001/U1103]|uniref:Uncharacterized protein n=1 Tax=Leishmania mexicana (strain MHOM/GT/2001/U1103) TaxID=929439 RepID=E9AQX0_LEIMU|nr:conserved hypothetical protein [Leishmania mexicana MHOM/GT/2001/U1103]CBZ25341.1 conserved hypothetical protein [Leishmania mexicana MHOM/GT/2001/U1103]
MLRWDWPQTWSLENREAIRVALETSIRGAMAKGESKVVRGLVHVELPEIGSTAPQVMLTGIRELSLEHTALMVKVRYDGEFSLKLRGLQVNVDTVGANSTLSSDLSLAMPFYCPLEMTLSDIHVDGVASIEVFQEIEDVTNSEDAALLSPDSTMGLTGTPRADEVESLSSLCRVPRSARSYILSATQSSTGRSARSGGYPSSGYGVLLGAGGRRAMRPPELAQGGQAPAAPPPLMPPHGNSVATTDASVTRSSGTHTSAGLSTAPSQSRHSLIDLASKRAIVKKRRIKVQLFGDPIKRYKVESNLVAVPGAGKKVEEHIQDMLEPLIERLMAEGVTIELTP